MKKKVVSRMFSALMVLAMVFSFFGQANQASANTGEQSGNAKGLIEITLVADKPQLYMAPGEETKIVITKVTKYANGWETKENVTGASLYNSSPSGVASVNVVKGLVKAEKEGTTTITVNYFGKKTNINVKVAKTAVTLKADKENIDLKANEEVQLNITEVTTKADGIPLENDVTQEAEYQVSNDQVISVNKGLVKALDAGTATITAKYGGKEVTVNVTVTHVPVITLIVDQPELSIEEGKEAQLNITEVTKVGDVETTKDVTQDATYTISDAQFASVNKGLVKALKVGTATITAKYGEKEVTVNVTVTPAPVITLEVNHAALSLEAGKEAHLTISEVTTTFDNKVTTKDVTQDAIYTVSDAKFVSVNKGLVKAIEAGTATITVKYGNNEKTVNVTVTKKPEPVVTLVASQTDLVLNPLETRKLTIKEVTTLDGKVISEKDVTKSAIYSVDKSHVAFVYKGYVLGFVQGDTKLTVKYGDLKQEIQVKVKFKFIAPWNLNINKEMEKVRKMAD